MLRSLTLVVALSFLAGCGGAEAELPCPSGFVRNDLGQCQLGSCEVGTLTVDTRKLTGELATRFAVGDIVLLTGGPFDLSANVVTFDGVSAAVSADPADPSRRLFATIPQGIPDAPANTGAVAKQGVCVRVETKSSQGSTSVTVESMRPGAPVITNVAPASPTEGEELTIVGTGFSEGAVVLLRDASATVVRRSAVELVVRVPDFPDILPGTPVPSALKLVLPDGAHALASVRIRGL